MEPSIANGRWKRKRLRSFLFAFAFLASYSAQPQTQDTLIDQTAVSVGKRVITIREIQLDWAINQTLDKKKAYEELLPPTSDKFVTARGELIKRALVRNYLTSTGLIPTDLQKSASRYRDELRAILSTRYSEYLQRLSTNESELDSIFQDRYANKTFLNEQLPLRTAVTEAQMREYYDRVRETRFLGQPYEKVKEIVREHLKREKMEKDLASWFQTEMKRTEVVVLPIESP